MAVAGRPAGCIAHLEKAVQQGRPAPLYHDVPHLHLRQHATPASASASGRGNTCTPHTAKQKHPQHTKRDKVNYDNRSSS